MVWQQWLWVLMTVAGAGFYIGKAGEERDPYPEGWALFALLVVNGGYLWLVVSI